MEPILRVQNLQVHFPGSEGVVRAVDDVSFTLPRGATLGVVGESGCGKSMTALAILRLIQPPGKIAAGEIWYTPGHSQGGKTARNLLRVSDRDMRQIRGAEIAMIFQEPMTALNPVLTIGEQVREGIEAHEAVSLREAESRTVEILRAVAIPLPEQRMKEYPHQLSGGLRQRAMIAMALAPRPRLLIADEPTTALDVTIQAQILELLARLKEELQLSLLMISHDLGVIAEIADAVAVMYAGKIVEFGPVREIFRNPLHPYTEGLLKSIPRWTASGKTASRLESIQGTVPDLGRLPPGCAFQPRCKDDRGHVCGHAPIPLKSLQASRQVRCVKHV
ncbi:MAG: ABC transporter ATP-binding protein [Acidobacteria bacterium]|nr:ABC transporter ATP-binding protein [Acidobacteriota bacterium]MCI0723309.1 ABC transporter ATP-binding protein [Acidobacteriota bacterium]